MWDTWIFNINIKSDKTKVKQCRRDFRKGNYREIRKNLAHIDILRGGLDMFIFYLFNIVCSYTNSAM